MTFQPPNNNLNPESQEWRRWVERALLDLNTANTSGDQTTAMALAGINASIGKLSDQVAAINTLQTQMATTISDLSDTQSDLATAVSDLATAQGQITTLLADQVKIYNNWSLATNFSLPTVSGATAKTSINFTTPAGYTKALVFSTVNDRAFNSTGSTDYLSSGLWIQGTGAGGTSPTALAGSTTISFASFSRNITGLTTGQLVTVESRPGTAFNPWSASTNNATTLSAFCIFSK